MEIKVSVSLERDKASVISLASDYKARGLDRHKAWDAFVIDRLLNPEIDARKFYQIYDSVISLRLDEIKTFSFNPTHLDIIIKDRPRLVQITKNDNGVYHLIWEDGSTGTNPPCFPPETNRFIPIIL